MWKLNTHLMTCFCLGVSWKKKHIKMLIDLYNPCCQSTKLFAIYFLIDIIMNNTFSIKITWQKWKSWCQITQISGKSQPGLCQEKSFYSWWEWVFTSSLNSLPFVPDPALQADFSCHLSKIQISNSVAIQ